MEPTQTDSWGRAQQVALWLSFCILTEALPIGGMLCRMFLESPAPSFRDILGYTTLVLVAIAVLAASLGDIVMQDLHGKLGPFMILFGLAFLLVLVGVFGGGVMLDADASAPGSRRFHPDEDLIWSLEFGFVGIIFCVSTFAKVWMLNQPSDK